MRRTQSAPALAHQALLGNSIQRNTSRVFVHLSAWLMIDSSHSDEHVAFVRDISPRGIFFYYDFKPLNRTQLTFVLEYLNGTNRVRLHLNGRIVRVEQATPPSATGIAVAFDSPHDDVPVRAMRMQ